jgi:glycosyltransferase involved in cell wall biosynthesis
MQISVLIPAYNEEKTIGKVVKDFKKQLPEAKIYVCDNNSNDKTAEISEKTGAYVLKENRQGKGYALQKLLIIKSDIYVMVDGDDTYPAEKVKNLIQQIIENKADMVIASRKKFNSGVVRNFGNFLISKLLNLFFKQKLHDALSGYRAFNHNLIKNLNLISKGFGMETELTIKAIENNFEIIEIPIDYRARKESKLRTYKDGIIIIGTLINSFIHYHPIKFFAMVTIIFIIAGLVFRALI